MEDNKVVGVVTRDDFLKELAQTDCPSVSEVMRRNVAVAQASDMLEGALQRLQESTCHTMPVLHGQRLVGLLTAENLGEFLMIRTARDRRKATSSEIKKEATV
jgi:predicted transcriptional regulator